MMLMPSWCPEKGVRRGGLKICIFSRLWCKCCKIESRCWLEYNRTRPKRGHQLATNDEIVLRDDLTWFGEFEMDHTIPDGNFGDDIWLNQRRSEITAVVVAPARQDKLGKGNELVNNSVQK